MTFRLIDAGGDLLVDAAGNYLVWQLEAATGSMVLAVSGPTVDGVWSSPSISYATSSPSIMFTISED